MTSKEFARLLGVSQSMISRALNDSAMVSLENRNFIKRKARELGFELNRQAQSLRTNRTGTVGILFPSHFKSMNSNPMLAHLYDHLQRELIRYDYDIMTVYDVGRIAGGATVLERMIKRRKVDGLITLRNDLTERELELVRRNDFPCVSMLHAKAREHLHYCISDSDYGGYMAGRYLGNFPDYEPMFIGVNDEMDETGTRCDGFQRGLADAGVTLPAKRIHFCRMEYEAAYRKVAELGRKAFRKKTSLFTHNDLTALGAFNALREMGVDVPGQVQIMGIDDIPVSSWMVPRLSTLHVAIEQMVPHGCKLLRDLIEHKRSDCGNAVFKPRLVLRDTTINTANPDAYEPDSRIR